MRALAVLRERLPSATGSTVIGCALLVGSLAAVLLHILKPLDVSGYVQAALGAMAAGLYAAGWPQHAAPTLPVTAADGAAPAMPDTPTPYAPSAAELRAFWRHVLSLPAGLPAIQGAYPVSIITSFESIVFNFLSRNHVASTEATVVADLQLALPMLEGLVGVVEVEANLSPIVKSAIGTAMASAQGIISNLSATAPVTTLDSAFVALQAVTTALPANIAPMATAALALVTSAYASFKTSLASIAPAPLAPATGG